MVTAATRRKHLRAKGFVSLGIDEDANEDWGDVEDMLEGHPEFQVLTDAVSTATVASVIWVKGWFLAVLRAAGYGWSLEPFAEEDCVMWTYHLLARPERQQELADLAAVAGGLPEHRAAVLRRTLMAWCTPGARPAQDRA